MIISIAFSPVILSLLLVLMVIFSPIFRLLMVRRSSSLCLIGGVDMIISVYGATCLDLHTSEIIVCTIEREPDQTEPVVCDCFSLTDFDDRCQAFSRSLKILEVDLLFYFDSDDLPF